MKKSFVVTWLLFAGVSTFAEQKITWNSAAAGIKVRGCNLATVMRTDNAEI